MLNELKVDWYIIILAFNCKYWCIKTNLDLAWQLEGSNIKIAISSSRLGPWTNKTNNVVTLWRSCVIRSWVNEGENEREKTFMINNKILTELVFLTSLWRSGVTEFGTGTQSVTAPPGGDGKSMWNQIPKLLMEIKQKTKRFVLTACL